MTVLFGGKFSIVGKDVRFVGLADPSGLGLLLLSTVRVIVRFYMLQPCFYFTCLYQLSNS